MVHSRGDSSQRVIPNMTENCLPSPPDAEAGFIPPGLSEPGHQGRYSEAVMKSVGFLFNNFMKLEMDF